MKEKSLKTALLVVSLALVVAIIIIMYMLGNGFVLHGRKATAIFLNGDKTVVLKSEKAAKNALDKAVDILLDGKRSEYEDVTILEDIEFKEIEWSKYEVIKADEAAKILSTKEKKDITYTIQLYDTPDSICSRFGISLAALHDLNKQLACDYKIGDVVHIKAFSPKITLETVRVSTFTEPYPFDTIFINSDQYDDGTIFDSQNGKEGERKVTARLTEINGNEIDRYDIEVEILSTPTNRIVIQGTRGKSTGHFIVPVRSYSSVVPFSRVYDSKGEFIGHTGIDFKANKGTDVLASDGGTVISTGTVDTLGLYVKIEHANGIWTTYANNSEVLVSVGDKVSQGQVIAKVGSSSSEGGTHLHFMTQQDHVLLDPNNYLHLWIG